MINKQHFLNQKQIIYNFEQYFMHILQYGYRYNVPNIKVPNHKIPNNKVPNNEIPK